MKLVRWLRAYPSLVVLVAIAGVAFGLSSLRTLPSGIYPDVDFPRVVIVARVGDLPPEVVQTVATRPLEETVATVPHAHRIRSRTIRGATEISVQFSAGTDMWRALQLVQTQVASVQTDLPAGVDLRVERVTPTALPIVTFNVAGDGSIDGRRLREVAARTIRPALTRVHGIGTVDVQGGDVREVEVLLRPSAVADLGLTPSGVADRLASTHQVRAVGRASLEHQILTVMVATESTTIEDLAALPIAMGANGPVPLSAVADVVEGAEDRTVGISGPTGDVVVITVSRAPGASAPDVVRGARDAIARLRREAVIPAGITVDTVYDQSVLIDDAMRGVRDAILIGIALGLVVLAAFLRDLRAGVAAAIAVPITLACTFGVMALAGETLNLMSLGGLAVAIGLVVDDAIVIVEAIVRRLEHGELPATAAERGTGDLFAAVVGTTVTTVIVFAPLALLAGVIGSFFSALAVTLVAAVLLSLVVSVTLVPLVAAKLFRARPVAAATESRLERMYLRVARRANRHPVIAVAAVVLLLGVGYLATRGVDTGFLPAMDEGAMVVDFFLPQGTSLQETDRIARRLDSVLKATPGIVAFTRRTGAEMGPAAATQQNRGDILVRLAARDRRRSVYAIMDDVRARAARDVPEARVEFVQVLQDVLDDLSGNPRPIEVKIFGPDQRELEKLARAAAARLRDLPELEDLFDGVEGSVPVQRLEIDPIAVQRAGVTVDRVASDLEVALAGRVALQIRRGDQNIGVRARFPDDVRFDPDHILAIPLSYGGTALPLSAFARPQRPVGPAVLARENLSPVIVLTAAVASGSDLGGASSRVTARLRDLSLPEGYRLEVGGLAESARQSRRDLARVFVFGLVLVLAVLLFQLRSLRLAIVVLAGVPLAIVGALLILVATGVPLNASSLMGCVLLAGLVVKNGILLFERALADSGTRDFRDAVASAGARRLRPILMTTAATIAGLVPLALAWGAGAELQQPLALVTIGGLLLSTLVTLLALPAIACAIMPRRLASSAPDTGPA